MTQHPAPEILKHTLSLNEEAVHDDSLGLSVQLWRRHQTRKEKLDRLN